MDKVRISTSRVTEIAGKPQKGAFSILGGDGMGPGAPGWTPLGPSKGLQKEINFFTV